MDTFGLTKSRKCERAKEKWSKQCKENVNRMSESGCDGKNAVSQDVVLKLYSKVRSLTKGWMCGHDKPCKPNPVLTERISTIPNSWSMLLILLFIPLRVTNSHIISRGLLVWVLPSAIPVIIRNLCIIAMPMQSGLFIR